MIQLDLEEHTEIGRVRRGKPTSNGHRELYYYSMVAGNVRIQQREK